MSVNRETRVSSRTRKNKRKEKKTKRKRKEADREFRKIRNQKWKYQTSRQNNFQKIGEWTRQDLKGEIEIRE